MWANPCEQPCVLRGSTHPHTRPHLGQNSMSAIMPWQELQQSVMQSDSADCMKPSGVLKVPPFSSSWKSGDLCSPHDSWNGESRGKRSYSSSRFMATVGFLLGVEQHQRRLSGGRLHSNKSPFCVLWIGSGRILVPIDPVFCWHFHPHN